MLPAALLCRPVFSTADARGCGVGSRDLARAVQAGQIVQVTRGWWSAQRPRWPQDRHLLRTQVAVRRDPRLVPSHVSGSVVAGLATLASSLDVVHLRRPGPGPLQRRRTVVVHPPPPEVQPSGPGRAGPTDTVGLFPAGALGLSVQDLPRVAVETALMCPDSGLMALDQLLRRRLVSRAQTQAWLAAFAQHRGVGRARAAVALMDARHESPGESRMAWVAHLLGYSLEPQVAVQTANGWRHLDAMIRGEWVALEHDGEEKYADTPARGNPLVLEKLREDDVRDLGVEVVRVTRRDLARPAVLQARVERARERARGRHGRARRPEHDI